MDDLVGNRVAIYARVSTPPQAIFGTGLQRQIEGGQKYAFQNYLLVAYTFQDVISRGSLIQERKGGKELIKSIEERLFEHVVIEDIDRLSENEEDVLEFYALCRQNNVSLHVLYLGGKVELRRKVIWSFCLEQNTQYRCDELFAESRSA